MKTILTRIRGVLGVPLVYVIRHLLIPEDEDDYPAFIDDDTIVGKFKYTSHDHETITRCPILTEDCNYDLSYDELEAQGPFVPTFLTDSKKVWAILHALFSSSGVWQHVKKFTATQDGRQVYCTLHSHFFGKEKVKPWSTTSSRPSSRKSIKVTARISTSTSIVLPMWQSTTATHLLLSTTLPHLKRAQRSTIWCLGRCTLLAQILGIR